MPVRDSSPSQDRLFFETLYDVLAAILKIAFKSQRNAAPIEVELGLLFRTDYFNKALRENNPPRSVDTLSLRELHAIKSDDNKLHLNTRMLTALSDKPVSLAVQVGPCMACAALPIQPPLIPSSHFALPAQHWQIPLQSFDYETGGFQSNIGAYRSDL